MPSTTIPVATYANTLNAGISYGSAVSILILDVGSQSATTNP